MAEDLEAGDVLRRATDALWRSLLDGILVLSPEGTDPLYVSSPGDLIWMLLAEPVTLAEVVDELSSHFEVDPEQVRADVAPVIRTLIEAGVVVVEAASV